MAEEKATVSGLVTDDILKQALASREVLNPLKAAVKKLLSEQLDGAVETALSSLTGQAVDTANDAGGNTVTDIGAGVSTDVAGAENAAAQPQPQPQPQPEAPQSQQA
ncbi:TPA: DUF826 domain-containing protein [Escherichia coli]|nr:DUF826 domain-containing protein [Escherichia coli]